MRREAKEEGRGGRVSRLSIRPVESESARRGSAPRVLLLEDNTAMRELMAESLMGEGYEVVESDSVAAWIERLAAGEPPEAAPRFDLVVSDIRMPGRTGLEILEGLRHFDFLLPVILVTAYGSEETHREAERLGATLLDKPFEMEDLLELARELCPPDEEGPELLAAVGF